MSEINCGIVTDLLPLYTENMLGEDSMNAVREHLESCEECGKKYAEMSASIPVSAETNNEEAKPLRKFRYHVLLNLLGLPLWLPLLLAAAAVVFALYAAAIAVMVALWSIPLASVAASGMSIVASAFAFGNGHLGFAFLMIGTIFAGAGIAVLSYYGCLWLSKKFINGTSFLMCKISGFLSAGKKSSSQTA